MAHGDGTNGNAPVDGTEYTGRTLVLLAEGATEAGLADLEKRAGIRVSKIASLGAPELASVTDGSVSFDQIGVVVIDGDPEQSARVAQAVADNTSPILATEPERVVYALARVATQARQQQSTLLAPDAQGALLLPPGEPENDRVAPTAEFREFLRGYRAAVCHLDDLLARGDTEMLVSQELPGALATDAAWGLGVTRVTSSQYSGRGIRVAVLDTGFDLHHPDFAGRVIVSKSFVANEAVQDKNGHGTHCIGTACGPKQPSAGIRYGVAYGAEIYAGKVLNNAGSGSDSGILAGIDWAVENRVPIVSMSLGARVSPGQAYSQVYETVASRAAAKGTIIIAAAGNDSRRPGQIAPVGHPANCPSVIAVGALDAGLKVGWFSNGGTSAAGGEVNVAGPGLAVYSSWPLPKRYHTIDGTSMATPHVAGIAALYAEATNLRGFDLANALLRKSRRLSPTRDFGWGLVQSP